MKKCGGIILIWALFEAVAVVLWITLHNIFYLFNFSYIGTCLSLGLFFYTKKYRMHGAWCNSPSACTCLFISVSYRRKTCRLKGSGIICFPACSRRPSSTMQLQRYSVPCCLDADGADTPAGRPWFWISFPSKHGRLQESAGDFSAMCFLPYLCCLSARCFSFRFRICNGSCSGAFSPEMHCTMQSESPWLFC